MTWYQKYSSNLVKINKNRIEVIATLFSSFAKKIIPMLKNFVLIGFFLIFINSYAQENNSQIPLLEYIEQLKEKNESLKNTDHVNVMVNDLLVENQEEYTINPSKIIRVEVLVIDPKKNTNNVLPSIIIGVKKE